MMQSETHQHEHGIKNEQAKPMSAAPMVYDKDGKIAWDKMWSTYCSLAKHGGPSHRGEEQAIKKKRHNPNSPNFITAMKEARRGIAMVAPYKVDTNEEGWITLELESQNVAKWFSDVINEENVESKYEGKFLLLPINDDFDITHDVKSIVTVVGKAYHYWTTHRSWFSKLIINLFGYDPQWMEV